MTTDEPISVTIREYWSIVVRRRWIIFATIVACVAIAVILCLVLPKSYRSSTSILIENAKIPEDYVKGIVGASVEERLTMLQQQVMSRTLLGQIVEEFDLYSAKVARDGVESVLDDFKKEIKVETVGTVTSRGKSVARESRDGDESHRQIGIQIYRRKFESSGANGHGSLGVPRAGTQFGQGGP
jgi:polysaccharide biosynthesis transport protein